MVITIEATRRISRRAVERIKSAFLEYDAVVYRRLEVEPPAEDVYRVIKQDGTFVLAIDDPSIK